jgi:hypothetical protein
MITNGNVAFYRIIIFFFFLMALLHAIRYYSALCKKNAKMRGNRYYRERRIMLRDGWNWLVEWELVVVGRCEKIYYVFAITTYNY